MLNILTCPVPPNLIFYDHVKRLLYINLMNLKTILFIGIKTWKILYFHKGLTGPSLFGGGPHMYLKKKKIVGLATTCFLPGRTCETGPYTCSATDKTFMKWIFQKLSHFHTNAPILGIMINSRKILYKCFHVRYTSISIGNRRKFPRFKPFVWNKTSFVRKNLHILQFH